MPKPAPTAAEPTVDRHAPRLTLVERSDFSRYRDGKYLGHAYRETRAGLESQGQIYAGDAYVFEETLRDMRLSSRRVDRSSSVDLELVRGSGLDLPKRPSTGPGAVPDSGFPDLRGLPSFPRDSASGALVDLASLKPGAVWTAPGSRALDFDGSGAIAILPFLAEYSYVGPVDHYGTKALSLKAKFATRWKGEPGGAASALVSSASGTHDLDIVVDAEGLEPLFIRDRFDESFVLVAGGTERRSGFSLYFFEGGAPLDRGSAGAAIAAAVSGAGTFPSGPTANSVGATAESAPPPGTPDASPHPTLLPPARGQGSLSRARGRPSMKR